MSVPILISWSGGKDSALALYRILQNHCWRVAGFLCTISQPYNRITMHGVRRALLEQQIAAMSLAPMIPILLPPDASNEIYEAAWAEALRPFIAQGIRHVAFGDIFLEDIRAYREQQLKKLGLTPVFPIWTGSRRRTDSLALLDTFWRVGFRTRIVCVDGRQLAPTWAGRELTPEALQELPETVDPCGENGEFHTFVFDGPVFQHPVRHRLGRRVTRRGFHFRDLFPYTTP
ncbi:Dph6-related ATP pyrophosphatase [Rhodothermus profundi]|uniref:MJ0570-related uncharacterized domain-containing protein n=1 Tax=Rhodothermus profundi TaxID=633813 RepID=A0A1M6SR34_9BACT|nr:hypothetical protein [Rhodothermus profundi]SHK47048.1 MJ0570-related uncharacterized domain-containing protein [Rhodothermus profundi]